MAIESPLFQSSMELLGHSITHFNGVSELDRKLLIIHLSNAVELLLKDMVLDGGDSIYKNPKETITIHGCIDHLKSKNVDIPYLNRIELLIDERNALQHRFGSPNELTAIFYMNVVLNFFRSLVERHYNQDFEDLISQFSDEKDLSALKMREPSNDSELESLKKLGKVHPLGALLSATAYMEKALLQFGSQVGITDRVLGNMPISTRYLDSNGIEVPRRLRVRLDEVRRIRNQAAHGRATPTLDDVVGAIAAIEELEKHLASIDLDTARKSVEDARIRRESEFDVDGHKRVLMVADQWMFETVKNFLMSEPAFRGMRFMVDVKESTVTLTMVPKDQVGASKVKRYLFALNEKGDNISDEASRIKSEILKDCSS